jgi:hypothetical protein
MDPVWYEVKMPCSHEDCPKDPLWRPVLELRSRPRATSRRLFLEQLGYCAEHKRTVTLADLLSAEGFDKIARTIREAGKEKIDRQATTLSWHPLSKRDLYQLRREQHHTAAPVPPEEVDADLAF